MLQPSYRTWDNLLYEFTLRIERNCTNGTVNVSENKGWDTWWWYFTIRHAFEGNVCNKVWQTTGKAGLASWGANTEGRQGQRTILLYLSVTEGNVGGFPLKGLVTGASKVVGGRIIFICL